jgi:hypothetical protein
MLSFTMALSNDMSIYLSDLCFFGKEQADYNALSFGLTVDYSLVAKYLRERNRLMRLRHPQQ